MHILILKSHPKNRVLHKRKYMKTGTKKHVSKNEFQNSRENDEENVVGLVKNVGSDGLKDELFAKSALSRRIPENNNRGP